jgi:hypothetical protein
MRAEEKCIYGPNKHKYEDTMYLPYTVGALVAFAWNDKTVEYRVQR